MLEKGNFEIMLQFAKIYQWSEHYNMSVLQVLCTIKQLTYYILYDFLLSVAGFVFSSARSSALISKKLVAFVTGLRQLRRFSRVYWEVKGTCQGKTGGNVKGSHFMSRSFTYFNNDGFRAIGNRK